ncbi:MAG TPA: sulfur carrier protein ThiS [Bryobacteraceae bacterium]|nr:sulfur carrier protein ThiS [Bryobacteraceae bacterium]
MASPETESNQSVVINGRPREIPAGLTVAALLRHLSVDPERVAIELNREIIRKPSWDSTKVDPGAELEIVQFVGGG